MLDAGWKKEAVEIFKLFVENFPNSANAHDSLGDGLEAIGNKQGAIRSAERALELLPNDKSLDERGRERVLKNARQKLERLKKQN